MPNEERWACNPRGTDPPLERVPTCLRLRRLLEGWVPERAADVLAGQGELGHRGLRGGYVPERALRIPWYSSIIWSLAISSMSEEGTGANIGAG